MYCWNVPFPYFVVIFTWSTAFFFCSSNSQYLEGAMQIYVFSFHSSYDALQSRDILCWITRGWLIFVLPFFPCPNKKSEQFVESCLFISAALASDGVNKPMIAHECRPRWGLERKACTRPFFYFETLFRCCANWFHWKLQFYFYFATSSKSLLGSFPWCTAR